MSGRWKEFRSKFDRYRLSLLEKDEREAPSSFNGLLDWVNVCARKGVPLLDTLSGDIAAPGVTLLPTRISSLEQKFHAGEKSLKARHLQLLGRLSKDDWRVQVVFTSTKAFLKRQSALEQEMASLRDRLSAALSTPSVEVESELSSVREDLAATNDTIGKLRAEMKKCRDTMDYNRRCASDQYSRAVDARLKVGSNHRREALAWEKCFRGVESKLSAAVDAEIQTREQNTKLAVHLARKEMRRMRMIDARVRVFASMNGLGTVVEDIAVRMGDLMDNLRVDLSTLVWTGPRAVYEELINFLEAAITAESVETPAAPGTRPLPTCEVGSTRGDTLINLDVVPSGSVPLPA